VIRTILTAAAAALAAVAFMGGAAQACISCEYVPEVVRQHSTADSPRYTRSHAPRKVYVERKTRRAKTHVARKEAPAKVAKVEKPAKTAKAAKPVKVAKSEARSAPKQQADKTISQAAKVPAKATESEPSSITVAAAETSVIAAGVVENRPTDCKKFFPAVGMTLTVPCE